MSQEKSHGHIAQPGGIFIYSENPGELAEWYREHLGIEYTYAEAYQVWYAQFFYRVDHEPEVRAYVVWSILKAKDKPTSEVKKFMVNYRVHSIEQTVADLLSKGVEVKGPEEYPEGKFAWIKDLDGNEMELWEDTTLRKG